MNTPAIKLACPICRRDMDTDQLRVEQDGDRYLLRCCCSLDDMYIHGTVEDAERSLSRYKGMAVKAGIAVAWERLKEQYEAAQEALGEEVDAFMVDNADHTADLLCRVYSNGGGFHNRVYCEGCLPRIVGDKWAYLRGKDLPEMCCRCQKVAGGHGGGISACPGDVAARDSY